MNKEKTMFEVHYVLPKGKHFCMVCVGEKALTSFITKLRRPAYIMSNGQHIGRVWKDGTRWKWFYDLLQV